MYSFSVSAKQLFVLPLVYPSVWMIAAFEELYQDPVLKFKGKVNSRTWHEGTLEGLTKDV